MIGRGPPHGRSRGHSPPRRRWSRSCGRPPPARPWGVSSPIISAAGRAPRLEPAKRLAEEFPGAPLILAHVAAPDLAWIWRELEGHPNLFIDTAWWNPADHVALFSHVPPGHVLFGSDTPYGTTVAAAVVALTTALGTGLSAAQVEAVCGGQLRRLLDGETAPEALDLGPAPGAPPPRSPLVERVFTLLVGALARMRTAAASEDLLALARLGCDIAAGEPGAGALADVAELLDLSVGYARTHELDGRRSAGFHLVLAAAALAGSPYALTEPPTAADASV